MIDLSISQSVTKCPSEAVAHFQIAWAPAQRLAGRKKKKPRPENVSRTAAQISSLLRAPLLSKTQNFNFKFNF